MTRRSRTRAGFRPRIAAIAGQAMRAGDAMLLVLAAANRDPHLNPHPARFEIQEERSAQLHLWPWCAHLPRRGASPNHRPALRGAADRCRCGPGTGQDQLSRLGERAHPACGEERGRALNHYA